MLKCQASLLFGAVHKFSTACTRSGILKWLLRSSCMTSSIHEFGSVRKASCERRTLNDMQVAYRGYWSRVLLAILQRHPQVSIKDLVELTSIKESDVTDTLYALGCIKYWKGEHILVPQGKVIEEAMEELEKKKIIGIDVSRLHWTPFSAVQPSLTGH